VTPDSPLGPLFIRRNEYIKIQFVPEGTKEFVTQFIQSNFLSQGVTETSSQITKDLKDGPYWVDNVLAINIGEELIPLLLCYNEALGENKFTRFNIGGSRRWSEGLGKTGIDVFRESQKMQKEKEENTKTKQKKKKRMSHPDSSDFQNHKEQKTEYIQYIHHNTTSPSLHSTIYTITPSFQDTVTTTSMAEYQEEEEEQALLCIFHNQLAYPTENNTIVNNTIVNTVNSKFTLTPSTNIPLENNANFNYTNNNYVSFNNNSNTNM